MKKLTRSHTQTKSSPTLKRRAAKLVAYLKKAYPAPKTELLYDTPFQLVVAVMLSAQCTDKVVNRVTRTLFKKYKTPQDFAKAKLSTLQKEISSITFYKNKARHVIAAAKSFTGLGFNELVALPGIGYKTAHVIRGELLDEYDGIPTDTHVKRFARRFGLTTEEDLKKISHDLEALVPKKDWKYVNNGLVLYGRYICPARPHDCTEHPLSQLLEKGRPFALQKTR